MRTLRACGIRESRDADACRARADRSPALCRIFSSANGRRYVFLAAAKVGGISPTTPIRRNSSNTTSRSRTERDPRGLEAGVKRLLFLGSSCIYPRDCPQPIKEEYLLTGPLESTNRALCGRQDRRHRDVLVLQPPARHALPRRNADQSVRPGRQLRPGKFARACRR